MANAGPPNNVIRYGWGTRPPQSAVVSPQNIILIHLLGEGSQGNVYKARVPLFGICAVKHLVCHYEGLEAEIELNKARELIAAQALAHHKNIVNFFGKIESVDDRKLTIGYFTEYMEGGNLLQAMNVWANEEMKRENKDKNADPRPVFKIPYFKMAVRWSVQVARALAFCHSQNVIHRDIKIENLLLSKDYMTIKICDFGLCRPDNAMDHPVNERLFSCNKGSTFYMAPEVIGEEGEINQYGVSADVYSFGMFLYSVFNKRHPFQERLGENIDESLEKRILFKKQLMKGVRPGCVIEIPGDIQDVMQKCWDTDKNSRPSMIAVVKLLETYWNKTYHNEEI